MPPTMALPTTSQDMKPGRGGGQGRPLARHAGRAPVSSRRRQRRGRNGAPAGVVACRLGRRRGAGARATRPGRARPPRCRSRCAPAPAGVDAELVEQRRRPSPCARRSVRRCTAGSSRCRTAATRRRAPRGRGRAPRADRAAAGRTRCRSGTWPRRRARRGCGRSGRRRSPRRPTASRGGPASPCRPGWSRSASKKLGRQKRPERPSMKMPLWKRSGMPSAPRLGEHRLHVAVVRVPAGRHHLRAAQAQRLDAWRRCSGACGSRGSTTAKPTSRSRVAAHEPRQVRVGAPQRRRRRRASSPRSGTAPAARATSTPASSSERSTSSARSAPEQCRWASMIMAACSRRSGATRASAATRGAASAPAVVGSAGACRLSDAVDRRGRWSRRCASQE